MYNQEIIRYITQYKIIEHNDKVIVGVSGGPDSMCLLHFLLNIKEKFNLEISVAHINHHTRGDENTNEENLVRNFCEQNNLKFFKTDFIFNNNNNFHDEARKYRYDFYLKLAKQLTANKIALAHHEDDQVETVLFKLIRGSNLNGYTGIKPIYQFYENISIIRPFLQITKKEILNYCAIYQIPYAIDSSNLENHYTRNIIRHEIVPKFKEIQLDFNNKIIQLKDQISEATDFIYTEALKKYLDLRILNDDNITLDINKLKNLQIIMLRYILLLTINSISNNSVELTYEKCNHLINIINNNKPNIIFNIGQDYFCIKEYDKLKFRKGLENCESYFLEINEFKEYILPNSMKISVKKIEEKAKINNNSLILCYNNTIWPLKIRTIENGDFIAIKSGHKKVSRIFIDAKIPTNLRKTWPILTDKNDNILWIVGIQKTFLKQDSNDKQYILIEVK